MEEGSGEKVPGSRGSTSTGQDDSHQHLLHSPFTQRQWYGLMTFTTILDLCFASLSPADSKAGQSYYFNLAFRVAVIMSKQLVERVHTTLAAPLSSCEGRETVDSDLRRPWEEGLVMEVLPAVRVWLEWVDRQEGIWTPLLSSTNGTHL